MNQPIALIIDDEEDLVDLLSYHLAAKGYEVLHTEEGKEAVTLAKEHTPQLILSNRMNGKKEQVKICKKLRKHKSIRKQSCLIILSTSNKKTTKELEKECKADTSIRIPMKPGKLIKKIQAAVTKKQQG